LNESFGQYPELLQDRDFVSDVFACLLTQGDLDWTVSHARWMTGPMKAHWSSMVTIQSAADSLCDKAELGLDFHRRKHCKRARRGQQKARVRPPRSKFTSFVGGRHKTNDFEDWGFSWPCDLPAPTYLW
jgi:hypothetical protein